MIEPLVLGLSVKPKGEATAIDESGVILIPVTGAVLRLGFLFGHTLR